MWSVGDVLEMLKEAGFTRIAVWVKPIQVNLQTQQQ
jgi:hypothetical protein